MVICLPIFEKKNLLIKRRSRLCFFFLWDAQIGTIFFFFPPQRDRKARVSSARRRGPFARSSTPLVIQTNGVFFFSESVRMTHRTGRLGILVCKVPTFGLPVILRPAKWKRVRQQALGAGQPACVAEGPHPFGVFWCCRLRAHPIPALAENKCLSSLSLTHTHTEAPIELGGGWEPPSTPNLPT